MKQMPLLLIFILLLGASNVKAQSDCVILRDGREMYVNIIQVDNSRILFTASNKKSAKETYLELRDVYMIHYEKRGNIYITSECKRITGENQKIEKEADVIYLINGKEIPAYNLKVQTDRIIYSPAKKMKRNNPMILPYSDVFMIKYADGTKDIINDITLPPLEMKSTPDLAKGEEKADKKNELQVIFHNVKKGETLKSIANRYDISVENIMKWNDISARQKPNAQLQVGMQIMLYVNPSN